MPAHPHDPDSELRTGRDSSASATARFPARAQPAPGLLPRRHRGPPRRVHPVHALRARVPRGPGQRRHRLRVPRQRREDRLRPRRPDGREHVRRLRRMRAGVPHGRAAAVAARRRGGPRDMMRAAETGASHGGARRTTAPHGRAAQAVTGAGATANGRRRRRGGGRVPLVSSTAACAQRRRAGQRLDEGGDVATLCPYCGVGCQTTYHVADDRILRVSGRDGPSNHERLCVKGRFGFDYVHHPQRLLRPLVRREGVPKDATRWSIPATARGVPRGDVGRGARPGRRNGLRASATRTGPGAGRLRLRQGQQRGGVPVPEAGARPASARTTSTTAHGSATRRPWPR
jgi:hypothetical protein